MYIYLVKIKRGEESWRSVPQKDLSDYPLMSLFWRPLLSLGIEKLGGTVNTPDDGSTMSSILSGSNCPKSEGRISSFLLLLLLSSPHLYLTNSVVSCHLLLGKTLWEILSRRRMSRLVFSWGKCEVINHSHKIINKSFTENDNAK